MAGKSDEYGSNFLKLVFNATNWSLVADNTATTPLTNLYASLHTADPAHAGNQTTNEIGYTTYGRVAVARTSGGWTISGSNPTQVAPASNISFPAGTGGSGTATYFGIGSATSGTGHLFYSGTVTPNVVCGNGITPILTTASTITEA